ncbi:MAG: hypothetical protein HY706_11910 [Candidatus Hydrogenedentes bacterium]|nr:hypothetical protein [Candidatus Hydrogenedentota bacterium]
MSTSDKQRERWLAYLLGDIPPEERDAVEAEMRQSPDEVAALRAVVEGVSRWANEPVPHSPATVQVFESETGAAASGFRNERPSPRFRRGWSYGVAAAAVLLGLLVSQARFSVSIGDVTFRWRQEVPTTIGTVQREELLALQDRTHRLEEAANIVAAQIEILAVENAALRDQLQTAAVRLAYNQRAESVARYWDIQGLLQLTSGIAPAESPMHDEN